MTAEMEARLEGLSRYIVTTPAWTRSFALILLLSACIEVMVIAGKGGEGGYISLFPVAAYLLPALAALALTPRCARLFKGNLTYDWSGLTALIGLVLEIFISLSPALVFRGSFPFFFANALAFIFAFRMLLLAAVVDFRISRVIVPALLHSGLAMVLAYPYLGLDFLRLSILLHISFAIGVLIFILVIERPLKTNFRVGPLELANAFLAHLSGGSRKLDEYFRSIGESVVVPQVSLFFEREGKEEIMVTIPNVHPGPLGETGGSALPKTLHGMLGKNSLIFHGSANHDFNPVDESEVVRLGGILVADRPVAFTNTTCTRSGRFRSGSVDVLAQAFGNTIVMAATRSPEVTEDLDFSVGFAIMKSGLRYFDNVGYADAHNCMDSMETGVSPATDLAMEHIAAAEMALAATAAMKREKFHAGYAERKVPFTRQQGFGDLGVQVLVIRTSGQTTAYVLFDGNNMHAGVRDRIREKLVAVVDECEVLTTDTHVVNTVSGRNQVGLAVPLEKFYPFVEEAVFDAITDMAPARSEGKTTVCRGVVVFGSQRISQIASTVNGMMGFLVPVAAVILVLAFLTTAIAYRVLTY